MTDESLVFDLPKGERNIIKVIGVGGGGSNAVNHMYKQGIEGVDFIVCNTDNQALDMSPVPTKIQLGESLTEGMGAGSKPEVGKNAAIESLDEIKALLEENTTMVFVTAGMGGGTGTGAAPVVAKAAKEMGILTVGIVTIPFTFEGTRRRTQADIGLEEMRAAVDTLLVIQNDKLEEMFADLDLNNAFAQADDVLTTAAKGIAEVISLSGQINVDMNDVKTVMTDSGAAIMGAGVAKGDDRAMKAVRGALDSPLLNDNNIKGADHVLLYISYGESITMKELSAITDEIKSATGQEMDMIWGHNQDKSLEDGIRVTLIATGFDNQKGQAITSQSEVESNPSPVEDAKEVTEEMASPLPSHGGGIQFGGLEETPAEPVEKEEPSFSEPVSEEPTFDTKPQTKIEFGFTQAEPVNENPAPAPETPQSAPEIRITELEMNEETQERISAEEYRESVEKRMERMRDFAAKIKTPNGLSAVENEPAFKRMNVELKSVAHSSENPVSKYRLEEVEDEDGTRRYDLRENNSFLHDNVD